MAVDGHAPTCDPARDQEEQTTGRGKSASRGFPGKLSAARNHAPEGATEAAILDVAKTALDRECHPRQVWEEGVDVDLADYSEEAFR